MLKPSHFVGKTFYIYDQITGRLAWQAILRVVEARFVATPPLGCRSPVLFTVMQSGGFDYRKENCPSLHSELLKTMAGYEDDYSSGDGGGKSRSVWSQLSDGGVTIGRRVRQRT
ncbi:BTB/POZ and MATH domain-containing protein 5 [Capsicum chinense]|nr:BTB/POZ and MATH domain-containing protein 5 [Capsicum chinense]